MKQSIPAVVLAIILSALLLTACPVPFDPEELSILQDLSAPAITFTTPLSGSAFQSTVTITGTIVDLDKDGAARTGAASAYIESAGYAVQGDETGETALSVGDDGGFSFTLATADYENQITVVVTASDRNGNSGSASLTLVPDSEGPFLVITSPEDYGEYATVITLSGYACNSVSDTAVTEVSPSLSYEMPGTAVSGSLTLDTDGTFTTDIDVSTLSGDRTIEVTASDLNGNETTAVITVVKPADGGDVSGFTVTPGNKSVTISWEAVPFAESYTIAESRYGMTRTDVTSPYVWAGLNNGSLYAFQLTAAMPESSGVDDAVSAEIQAVPLSPLTLSPWVKGLGYESVTIEWRDYQEIAEYTVERSVSPDGPWSIRRKLTDNAFTDTGVSTGTTYFYRVSPTSFRNIMSDPLESAPARFLGEYAVAAAVTASGSANSATVSGDYLYVTAGSALDIFDCSDPLDLVLVGSKTLSGTTYDVAVSAEGFAYVAVGTYGVAVIDVSDPGNLDGVTPVYAVPTGSTRGVALSGNYVYAAAGGSGLCVINIMDPASPVPQATLYYEDTTGVAYDVAVSGSYAYVADYNSGLAVIGITTPTNPDTPVYMDTTGNAAGVAVDGTWAYLATGELAAIDITTPTSPGSPYYADVDGTACAVTVDGDFAFVACTTAGMAVVDLTPLALATPLAPSMLAQTDTSGYAYGVAVSGTCAYIADMQGGVKILSIGKPETDSPVIVSESMPDITEVSGTEYGYGIAAAGGYAFASFIAGAGDKGGLASFDISNAADPSASLAYVYLTSPAYAVAVSGSFAYVANYNNGLAVIDISNPSDLGTPAYADTEGSSYDVAVAGDFAYIADAASGLAIFDISDPGNPSDPWYASTSAGSGSARGVSVSNDHAFVADGSAGLAVIDISDPEDPGTAVYMDTNGYASDVAVRDGYAFIADSSTGLAVIDISDPANPGSPVYRDTAGSATNICVSGDYAYLSCGDDTIAIINVSDPEKPWPPTYITLAGTPHGISTMDGCVFAADSAIGFSIVTLTGGD